MRHLFTFIVLIGISSFVFGQDESVDNSDLDELTAPSTPSAAIIGTQVNDISKPQTVRAFKAELLNNYIDEETNLTLPSNYAIEFNPYKLMDGRTPSMLQYLDLDPLKNLPRRFYQNLAVSMASTNDFVIQDTLKTSATGFGFRTVLFNGKPSTELIKTFKTNYLNVASSSILEVQVRTAIGKVLEENKNKSSTLKSTIEGVKNKMKRVPADKLVSQEISKHLSTEDLEANKVKMLATMDTVFSLIDSKTEILELETAFETAMDKIQGDKLLKDFKASLNQINTERYGLQVDVNGALGLNFPTNKFEFSIIPRWGVWTNIAYTFKKSSKEKATFQGILLARYIKNNNHFIQKYRPVDTLFTAPNTQDIGTRLVYKKDKFSFELEYIYRWNRVDTAITQPKVKMDSRKYVLNINYSVSPKLIISYNLGKGFDQAISGRGTGITTDNLISGLSLNLGFGAFKPSKMVDKVKGDL